MADDAAPSSLVPAPTFSAETPRPRRAPLGAISDPVPLFAQPERAFAMASRVAAVAPAPGGARVTISTDAGEEAELLVQRTVSGALRLRWSFPPGAAGTVRDEDRMLAGGAEPDTAATVEIGSNGTAPALTLHAPAWRFTLDHDTTWHLDRADGSPLCAPRTDDRNFPHWSSRPLATSGGPGLRTWSNLSLALHPGERLYGLGQQYGELDKRGSRLVQWNRDAVGSNGSVLTYHNTPFCWSSRGYGLVVHAAGRVMWEMGHPSHETLTVAAAGEVLDLYVLTGETPADMLRAFYALAGPAGQVPDWALGIWMSRCQYASRAEVEQVVEGLREIDFPLDVIHLDPRWMRLRRGTDNDHGADFVWDEEQFGDPRAFFAWARESAGVRVSLWENPYALRDSWTHREMERIGGLARTPEGEPARPFEALDGQSHVVDFTNPAVQRWWAEQHLRLLDLGAAAFKTDFAEGVPDDAQFADGRTGEEMHNVYALLFNRLVYETVQGAGHAPFVYGRSGWLGSHRYPLQWSGDPQCTWSDMRGALRAGLSAALSGTATWGHDIGGFYTLDHVLPDGELYARWAWLGCLSPIARFHGTSPREPYVYEPAVRDAAVAAARVRYRLMPYLAAQSRRIAAGLPMLRPLVLAFPDDPLCWHEATQYMLGDDLLVAPLLEPGGRRRVHLPAGRWGDWWTGATLDGPSELDVELPLDRVPLYQREGSVVPLGQGRRVAELLAGPITEKRWDEPYVAAAATPDIG